MFDSRYDQGIYLRRYTAMPTPDATLATLYTGIIHDVMRDMGCTNFVLPASIRPLMQGHVLSGPIQTVEGRMTHAPAHETLLAWTGLLSKAKPRHVLMCQPHNHEIALMGELSGETLKDKGVLGYVVDGGCRDTEFLLKMGFPVWHTFFTPKDIVGRWLPTAFGAAIQIGDVTVHDGDFFLGDRDGALVIPKAKLDAVVSAASEAAGKENLVRTGILSGMDPQEAYLKYGKF
jgi:regulator of RNase E activity RraA